MKDRHRAGYLDQMIGEEVIVKLNTSGKVISGILHYDNLRHFYFVRKEYEGDYLFRKSHVGYARLKRQYELSQ